MTEKKSEGKTTSQNTGSKIGEIVKNSPNVHLVKVDQGKPEVKTPLPGEAKKPTYEDLLKRLEELEKQHAKKPANIQEVINFFEDKKKKITHLELFKKIRLRLNEALNVVKPQADDQEFEKQEFVLTFAVHSNYSKGEELFKITNPLIITKCIGFLRGEIDQKTAALEEEIKADF
ncbi:MAG: hypothetical protein WCX31_04575 [Salinivirgaceae bacterium]